MVSGAANITFPGEPVQTETFTKRAVLPWVWYTGGGALLVLLLAAVWLVTRTHRRRRAEEEQLRAGELSQDRDNGTA
jgi:membrane protein implicated in regulation of membrane protease activity